MKPLRSETLVVFALLTTSTAGAFTFSFTSPLSPRPTRNPSYFASSTIETDVAMPSASSGGPLTMSMDELAIQLGGMGRAKLAWDCYTLGVDPIHFFANNDNYEHYETIRALLPSQRRSTTLGKEALQRLSDLGGLVDGGIATLSLISTSADKTTKLLLKLKDGLQIETVIIPWDDERSTVCISSQVGCKQACSFCATGKMGILRNLCADEIIAQVVFALRITRLNDLPPITHVVFMGMGEPADNVDAVVKAAQQLTTRELFQLSRSKVTISTVAPSPEVFERLAQANVMLAWSVHASEDGLRKRLVPTTKHTMAELRRGLISALKTRHPTALRTLMVEVALMEDINDRMEDADHLAQFLSTILVEVPGSKLAVNLIPFNDTGHPTYKTPSLEAVSNFQKRLWEHGIAAFVRTTRGDDESSACGQLATTKKPKD